MRVAVHGRTVGGKRSESECAVDHRTETLNPVGGRSVGGCRLEVSGSPRSVILALLGLRRSGQCHGMNRKVESFHELETYRESCALDLAVFKATQSWPKEEMYSLTDQIRRSSRSVGANIAEAWLRPVRR